MAEELSENGRAISGLIAAGSLAEANAAIMARLNVNQYDAEAVYLLGTLRLVLGQNDAALRSLQGAFDLAPGRVEFARAVAELLIALGRNDEAGTVLRRALVLTPQHPTLLRLHGAVIGKTDPAAAIALLEQAAALAPEEWAIWNELGSAYTGAKRYRESRAFYLRAHQLCPQAVGPLVNLALRSMGEGLLDEALDYFDRALALSPGEASIWNNRGTLHLARRDPDRAEADFAKAAELAPDLVSARVLMAMPELMRGHFAEGFARYERRLEMSEISGPPHPTPRWDGRPDPSLRLLVKGEQGLGDAMQFCRYLPLMAGRVGSLVYECADPLHRLMRANFPYEVVGARGSLVANIAAHVYLMSGPYLFGTTLETVPAEVPYLRSVPGLAEEWAGRLGPLPGLRVGLVWRGNRENSTDLFRSSSLAHFAALFEEPGITFVSLVPHPAPEDDVAAAPLVDVTGGFKDFADTAAVIDNLDVVVSVDTSVAHLAGAMGKPTLLVLPYSGEWRWMLGTDRSPWYPTMRIYRQPAPNRWEVPLQEVRAELACRRDAARRPVR